MPQPGRRAASGGIREKVHEVPTANLSENILHVNWKFAREASDRQHGLCHKGHVHSWSNLMSRRQFARNVAGVAAASAAFGLEISEAGASAPGDPVPIPGGEPKLGGMFHVFGPSPDGSFSPVDAEPITITNFNGFVGLAYINGTVQRTNKRTGKTDILKMIGADMRFMTGVYRGADERIHQGAFAFV